MKCFYHSDLDSVHRCSTCSRNLCASCAHTIKGRVYCQDCLVAGVNYASLAREQSMAGHSPRRAGLFALLPGVGAVYNQQYVKAVQHFAIFAALVILADSAHGIFVLATIAFWLFSVIDAYRSAQSILLNRVKKPSLDEENETRVPIWGVILILLGVVFFLDNQRLFSLRNMIEFLWPLLFVITGLYLVWDFYRRSGPSEGSGHRSPSAGPPAEPPERPEEESVPSHQLESNG